MNSFYTIEELKQLGLKSFGTDVLISKKVSIYGASKMSLGNNVRIDDFCILSGDIQIGNYVHISAYCALYGKDGIRIGDYCGCSARCTLYSASDDFSGEYMISPLVPKEYTNVQGGPIKFENFVQLGANSIVMPSVTIEEGTATGTFTFVNKSLNSWTIYAGIPAKKIKERSKNMLILSKKIEGSKNEN
ncbi:MAG: acyltransferase [Mollicutes bacterium]|nr:acyltransferase [Mollicutes bacterium]